MKYVKGNGGTFGSKKEARRYFLGVWVCNLITALRRYLPLSGLQPSQQLQARQQLFIRPWTPHRVPLKKRGGCAPIKTGIIGPSLRGGVDKKVHSITTFQHTIEVCLGQARWLYPSTHKPAPGRGPVGWTSRCRPASESTLGSDPIRM